MHPYDQAGNRHMEYVRQRGSFDDLPLEEMLADFREMYGGVFGEASATSAEDAGDAAFSAGS
jgi:nicotinamide riboside kinase